MLVISIIHLEIQNSLKNKIFYSCVHWSTYPKYLYLITNKNPLINREIKEYVRMWFQFYNKHLIWNENVLFYVTKHTICIIIFNCNFIMTFIHTITKSRIIFSSPFDRLKIKFKNFNFSLISVISIKLLNKLLFIWVESSILYSSFLSYQFLQRYSMYRITWIYF